MSVKSRKRVNAAMREKRNAAGHRTWSAARAERYAERRRVRAMRAIHPADFELMRTLMDLSDARRESKDNHAFDALKPSDVR
jgi:predicted O-methyltransferase YrrM